MNEFNAHFSKYYHIIPTTVRPNTTFVLVYYLEKFDEIFSMFFRNSDHETLDVTFSTTLKIEKNVMASQKTQ